MASGNALYAANLPVVTGHVTSKYAIKHLLPLGQYIQEDEFWDSMIEQINITENGNVELVPRVGNHIVYLGKPEQFEDKLYRLKIFYEKALSQIGWNKYSRINLEFSNQIICTKK
jgi:cell division protein FtsQ